MKTLIIVLALAISTTAIAKDKPTTCERVESLARVTMKLRQNGVSLKRVLGQDNETEYTRNMLLAAYSKPRYNTKAVQDRVIGDFANKYFLACLKFKSKEGK